MKKLLNTLYVTSEQAWLRKDGLNVVVQIDGAERGRAPVHLLGQIVCFGPVGLTPALIGFCATESVSIALLSRTGQFQARVEGPQSGNVLLRRAQHDSTRNNPVEVARMIVSAKAANQRGVLRRYLRDYGQDPAVDQAGRRLSDVARRALETDSPELLRGLEGEGASAYFSAFSRLIRAKDMPFRGRSRRPPKDRPNALLSFLYTLLVQDCRAAAESMGLDPQMGFCIGTGPVARRSHSISWRSSAHRWQIGCAFLFSTASKSAIAIFAKMEQGVLFLNDDGRRAVLAAWQDRKRQAVRHPVLKETVDIGLLPHVQAQLLVRHLRGDLDGYPAYVWR